MNDARARNRLLIADDALIIRRRIAAIASEAGWEVVAEAKNGAEAVEAFRERRPDLVTLDIVMPKMDGVQALRQIMQTDASAQVVMVTAVNQKQQLEQCIHAGAIDFIVKPFAADRLRTFFANRRKADTHS